MNINNEKIFKYFRLCLKLIISLLFSYFIMSLLLVAYAITKVPVNIFLVFFLLTFLLIYANWAIWSKGIFKKFIMFFTFFAILVGGILWGFDYMGIQSDYCLEDGDCKEGRMIFVDNKEILLNKKTCLENNWRWYEENKICKIDTRLFRVKEVVYD